MKSKVSSILAVVALSLSVSAHAAPEDLIKYRQSGYSFMAWNMARIKGLVIDNPAGFNKEQVVAAANAIAAIANSGMGALFAPGTEKGKGWKETRVKEAFFKQPEDVKKIAMAFGRDAGELARIAATGDINAIRSQYGKVGEACKSCHDSFRTPD